MTAPWYAELPQDVRDVFDIVYKGSDEPLPVATDDMLKELATVLAFADAAALEMSKARHEAQGLARIIAAYLVNARTAA